MFSIFSFRPNLSWLRGTSAPSLLVLAEASLLPGPAHSGLVPWRFPVRYPGAFQVQIGSMSSACPPAMLPSAVSDGADKCSSIVWETVGPAAESGSWKGNDMEEDRPS